MGPQKKKTLISALAALYPEPRSELNFANHYQLLISVMLSAQCTDKKVNQVTPELFGSYSSFVTLSQAKLKDVERIIRPINYFKTKSKNLIATAKEVMERFDGEVPETHEELTSLPGVGNKTANVVLGELGIEPTIAVDTHVFRVSNRLGIAKGKTPLAVEQELKQRFPIESWRELHHRLIFHGRRVCKAQNPQCKECELSRDCPSADQF